MPKSLHSMVPDVDTALELEPEELGEILLEHIQSLPPNELGQLNRGNFFRVSFGVGTFPEYPREQQETMAAVFTSPSARKSAGCASGMPRRIW